MNEVNKEDFSFEGSTVTWQMSFSTDLGQNFSGLFRFKCIMTPMDRVTANRNYRELIGDANPTFVNVTADNIAHCASELKQRVVSSPAFWDDGNTQYPGTQIPDGENLLVFVLRAAVTAEEMYRDTLKAKHTANLERLQAHLKKLQDQARVEQELANLDATPNAANQETP